MKFIKDLIQSREDRKLMKEYRKLQETEENVANEGLLNFTTEIISKLIAATILFTLVAGLLIDFETGLIIACFGIITLFSFSALMSLGQAVIYSIKQVANKFKDYGTTVAQDRAYNETQKIIDYAIKTDKISDEHITKVIDHLLSQTNNKPSLIASVREYEQSQEQPKVIEATPVEKKEETNNASGAQYKCNLDMGSDSFKVINASGNVVAELSYDQIHTPQNQEEINAMPDAYVYGYVELEDKTIYLYMADETALVVNK